MSAKNSILFEHVQRFVQEVFADQLRKAGFVSYKGEDINWYRLVNGDVLQTVYFYTRHKPLPAAVEIGYGCHPLFVPPLFQKGPYLHAEPGYERSFHGIPEIVPGGHTDGMMGTVLIGSSNYPYRIPDILVDCPKDNPKEFGQSILNQIFKVQEHIQTPRECYEAHKKWNQKYGSSLTMSPYFADEAVFWADTTIYPHLMDEYLVPFIALLESAEQSGRYYRREDAEHLKMLRILKDVIVNGKRDEHLLRLQEQEERTIRMLEKYTSIRVL